MKINQAGYDLIKRWEGCELKAYLCPANVWTIGYGHTEGVHKGQVITLHQAEVILESDLEKYEEGVTKMLGGLKVTANQFSALVSFAFNLGITALANSTLLKMLKAGNHKAAAEQFGRWVKAGGKTLPGLVKRRAAEMALFLA